MTLTGGAGASHRPVGRPLTGCEREDVSDGSAAQLTSSADMDDAADPQSLEDRVSMNLFLDPADPFCPDRLSI